MTINYSSNGICSLNLPIKKTSCSLGFPGEFYKMCKKSVMSALYKFLQKIEQEGIFLNLFSVASITMIPKLNKNISRKENQRQISLINIDARNSKILESNICKNDNTSRPRGIYPRNT